jgi:hypothetical protein
MKNADIIIPNAAANSTAIDLLSDFLKNKMRERGLIKNTSSAHGEEEIETDAEENHLYSLKNK